MDTPQLTVAHCVGALRDLARTERRCRAGAGDGRGLVGSRPLATGSRDLRWGSDELVGHRAGAARPNASPRSAHPVAPRAVRRRSLHRRPRGRRPASGIKVRSCGRVGRSRPSSSPRGCRDKRHAALRGRSGAPARRPTLGRTRDGRGRATVGAGRRAGARRRVRSGSARPRTRATGDRDARHRRVAAGVGAWRDAAARPCSSARSSTACRRQGDGEPRCSSTGTSASAVAPPRCSAACASSCVPAGGCSSSCPRRANGPEVEHVRFESDGFAGPWFSWAHVSIDALSGVARDAGLAVQREWCDDDRWFAWLG